MVKIKLHPSTRTKMVQIATENNFLLDNISLWRDDSEYLFEMVERCACKTDGSWDRFRFTVPKSTARKLGFEKASLSAFEMWCIRHNREDTLRDFYIREASENSDSFEDQEIFEQFIAVRDMARSHDIRIFPLPNADIATMRITSDDRTHNYHTFHNTAFNIRQQRKLPWVTIPTTAVPSSFLNLSP